MIYGLYKRTIKTLLTANEQIFRKEFLDGTTEEMLKDYANKMNETCDGMKKITYEYLGYEYVENSEVQSCKQDDIYNMPNIGSALGAIAKMQMESNYFINSI